MKKTVHLERTLTLLHDKTFITRYKRSVQDFTRSRVLTFQVISLMLLAQGKRSLQLALNEIIPKLGTIQCSIFRLFPIVLRRCRRVHGRVTYTV